MVKDSNQVNLNQEVSLNRGGGEYDDGPRPMVEFGICVGPKTADKDMVCDETARIVNCAITVLGIVLTLTSALTFCRFKTPTFVDEEKEDVDLALCFHLNLAYRHCAMTILKGVALLVAIGMAVFGVGSASHPLATLEEIWFDLCVTILSINSVFDCTDKCSLTYGEYQTHFLSDLSDIPDKSLSTLFQPSHLRVLGAISRQVSNDVRSGNNAAAYKPVLG